MFTTRDYLTLSPWEALIEIINDEHYLQLDPGTVTLKAFTPLTGTRTEVVVGTSRSTNEANILPVLGDLNFQYDRLRLSDFLRQVVPLNVRDFKLPINTMDVVKKIGQVNNIVFDIDDFQHTLLTSYPSKPVILYAGARSLRWYGNLQFQFINEERTDLSLLTQGAEYPNALSYPGGSEGTIQGPLYSSFFDFSEFREFLLPVKEGGLFPSGNRLAAILGSITGDDWRCNPVASPFNLCTGVRDGEARYTVVYHGPAVKRYTQRSEAGSIIVLQLDKTFCTGVSGTLVLHYDMPQGNAKPTSLKQQLLDALNNQYRWAHPLLVSDVDFSAPEAKSGINTNTFITVTAKASSVYFKGSVNLYYNRLKLDSYLKGLRIPGSMSRYATVRQAASALASYTGAAIDSSEIVANTLGSKEVTLRAMPTSVGLSPVYQVKLPYAE